MDPRYVQQMPKGDCMQSGIISVTTTGTNTASQMAYFSGNLRTIGNWDRQQRMMYMPQSIASNMSQASYPNVYLQSNRRACQFGAPEETVEMAIATQRTQFVQPQIEGGFTEADMFLVDEEELFRHESQACSAYTDTGASAARNNEDEQDMETKTERDKSEKEEAMIKQDDVKEEDESEEARALRIKEKNRIAAKICRRRKKEYIRCLEQRVASLEKQNEALLLKLKFFKDIYDREHNFGC